MSMSGLMFGLIVGYLSWYAMSPGKTRESIPIEKIAALLGVIGGTSVLALFPSGTNLFERYGLGLGTGFFFVPIRRSLWICVQMTSSWVWKFQGSLRDQYQREIESVDRNWVDIERLVDRKLDVVARLDERVINANYIDLTDLQELQYPPRVVRYIMRRFAEWHVRDGVEYRVWDGKPALFRRYW